MHDAGGGGLIGAPLFPSGAVVSTPKMAALKMCGHFLAGATNARSSMEAKASIIAWVLIALLGLLFAYGFAPLIL